MFQTGNLKEIPVVSGCTSHHQLNDQQPRQYVPQLFETKASTSKYDLCRGTGSIACALEKDADSLVPKNVCMVRAKVATCRVFTQHQWPAEQARGVDLLTLKQAPDESIKLSSVL